MSRRTRKLARELAATRKALDTTLGALADARVLYLEAAHERDLAREELERREVQDETDAMVATGLGDPEVAARIEVMQCVMESGCCLGFIAEAGYPRDPWGEFGVRWGNA